MVTEALYRVSQWCQQRIIPELEYSQTQFERDLTARGSQATAWLDLGCGHRMLPEWRAEAERALLARCPFVVGIDFDLPSLTRHRSIQTRVRGDARVLPFADRSFDLVTANMVVEHLDDPVRQFAEICRVLRDGGVFLFHTPNADSYIVQAARLVPDGVKRVMARVLEGRAGEDVFPTHYRANTLREITEVAQASGFVVDEVRPIFTSPVFGVVPPLAAAELLFLRSLRHPSRAHKRPDLICALRRVAA
jgi:SAM-dependent methyltransferase